MRGNPIHWRNREHAARLGIEAVEEPPPEYPDAETLYAPPLLPPIDTAEQLRARYMSPEALELKRRTPVFST